MLNQNQIKDLIFADVTAAEAAGRPNEVCYVQSLKTFYDYVVAGSGYTVNHTSILSTGNGGNTRWLARAGQYSVNIYKTIYIDAAEFIPCTHDGALQGTYEEPNNDIDLDIFLFEGGVTPQRIMCKRKLDENWDRGVIIGAKFDWNSESGSTAGDTVEWRIKMGAVGDGDAIDAALGTRQVISDTLLADNGGDWQTSPKTPNITVAGSPTIGDAILIEIDRNGPGADTMAEKARFQGVTLQIKLSGAVVAWT